jgi:hypothetical protein
MNTTVKNGDGSVDVLLEDFWISSSTAKELYENWSDYSSKLQNTDDFDTVASYAGFDSTTDYLNTLE